MGRSTHHCERLGVPPDGAWVPRVREYERDVLARRG
jgi:L-rhamnose isomerase